MLWFEVCLDSWRGGTRFRAGLENIVGQRNGDDCSESEDEEREELSLGSISVMVDL